MSNLKKLEKYFPLVDFGARYVVLPMKYFYMMCQNPIIQSLKL